MQSDILAMMEKSILSKYISTTELHFLITSKTKL